MTETTRIEVWEQIRASELCGSDVVPLSIETTKLLLECARLINEAASKMAVSPSDLSDWRFRQSVTTLAARL